MATVFSLSCLGFILLTAATLAQILKAGTPGIAAQVAWTLSPVLVVLTVTLLFQAM